MKTPESGTEVFNSVAYTGNATTRALTAGFTPDLVHYKMRNNSVSDGNGFASRLQGAGFALVSNSAGAEAFYNTISAFGQNGITATSSTEINGVSAYTYVANFFRRAPGFFDVVAYAGTGSATTVSHNLGVVPELMIVKSRSNGSVGWSIYSSGTGNTHWLTFDPYGAFPNSSFWNNTSPTSSVFTLGTGTYVNGSGSTYIAYLFASAPGVSKCGSYTGTGTTLSIDCGFTAGARFVLIKRTDSMAGGSLWFVWDSARGIVSGNDPYLTLESTAAEVTNTDYIDPLSSGFQISSTAPAAINASSGSFIFLAVA